MGLNKRDSKTYAGIFADGTIKVKVDKGTEGAVLREYEDSKGNKGEKWELVYGDLSGIITGIEIRDGKFGEELIITIDGVILQVNLDSNFGTDIAQKLPNVDLDIEATLAPYSFTPNDSDKEKKGVSITQLDKKIENFFYDSKNGIPKFPSETARKTMKKPDWKKYRMSVTAFLREYIEKNLTMIPTEEGEDKMPDFKDKEEETKE